MENGGKRGGLLKVLCIIAAIMSTLALHCTWGLYGDSESDFLVNSFRKLAGTFTTMDFMDVLTVIALSVFFIKVVAANRFDLSALILSLVMSVLYIVCRQYRDYDSLQFLLGSGYSLMVFALGICGYTVLLYAVLVFFKVLLTKERTSLPSDSSFFRRFFWPISWIFILVCYLPWILLNYPGSGMPDTILQFQNYFGDTKWSMWQPPLSSLLMGWCYSIGGAIKDANFGFFLYALLQTVTASGIFSYAINRLKKLGAATGFCVTAVLFYGLVPMWGAYAQWVEKDFLFASMCVLFTTYLLEICAEKAMSAKTVVKLSIAGLLCVFLRNNGIYAVIPALVILGIYMSGAVRKGLLIIALSLLITYESVTRIVFPAVGVGRTSISETIGFMLQQTARYVNTYPDELSEEDKEILTQNFRTMDAFKDYNPKFIDPVKYYYVHATPKEYFSLWIRQFCKHPTVYAESYLNGSYGYWAPVEGDVGAYIHSVDDGYLYEQMGITHDGAFNNPELLIAVLNPSKTQIFIRYFTYPGLYTWGMIILLYVVAHKKKKGAWAVFVPALVTVLVCSVSPLACAMRYALPFVAAFPVLAGWTTVCDLEK